MTPLAVLFWRFGTAALLSWLYLSLRRPTRASLRVLSRRRVTVLVLLGALYVGNSFAYFAALEVVPIALTSIITYLYPAIVAVVGGRLVRRLEGRRAWIALGLSLVGVALAVGAIPEGELPPLWGLALAFANAVIYATWIVLQARLAGDRPRAAVGAPPDRDPMVRPDRDLILPPGDAEAAIEVGGEGAERRSSSTTTTGSAPSSVSADVPDPAAATAIMTTATAGTYALLASASGVSISPADVPAGLWPPLLAFGLVATALAIQTFYAGVRRIGAARASIVSTIEPVYTITLAVILFGETLAPIQVLGGVLVLAAVLLAETGRPERADPATPLEPATAGHSG
jgi:drug/metabolite transporter (DMT)-like permease